MSVVDAVSDVTCYLVDGDKKYELINYGLAYGDMLMKNGAKSVIAAKCGCVLARPAKSGEVLSTHAKGGVLESECVATEDSYVVTKADDSGNPILDEYGYDNSWLLKESVLRDRYDVPDGAITEEILLKPKYHEQHFIQVDRNVAFMLPWGKDGVLVPQYVDAGGYMSVSDPNDIYGISEGDFNDTYRIVRDITIK